MSAATFPATRAGIVAAARSLLGTRYLSHQRVAGPDGGTDCIGLPVMVAWATGIKPRTFDVNGYPLQPDGSLLPLADLHLERTTQAAMDDGDMVVVSWGDKAARHFGIVAPHSQYPAHKAIIHAYPKLGRVVEHRLEFGHFMRFVAAYRFPGVA
jgi:cell wall-associated NlpC family hydrolase